MNDGAATRRDDGIRRAVEHADSVEPSWSDRAGAMLLQYAASREAWMAEDLREWAHARGLPSPPDGRAWGVVVRRAAAAGHIVKVGAGPARSSNLSLKHVWCAA